MNRQAQALLLFVVGAAVCHAGIDNLYLRYVKAGLRPLLLAGGIVLMATAIATAWYEIRRPRETRHHHHREPRTSWLLILPLFALVLLAPPALDSYSAMRAGTVLPQLPGFPALSPGDPLRLSLVDYAGRAVYDHGRSLGRRRVTVSGFVAYGRGGTVYLVRVVLNCCAADAQPVKIALSGQVPPILQPDTWLDVTGTYTDKQTTDPVNNGAIPFLDVLQATPITAPTDPYESFG